MREAVCLWSDPFSTCGPPMWDAYKLYGWHPMSDAYQAFLRHYSLYLGKRSGTLAGELAGVIT